VTRGRTPLPTLSDRDRLSIRRAVVGDATEKDWLALMDRGLAVMFADGRVVLTLPARDAYFAALQADTTAGVEK
jgi:hypothetical protein